MLLTVCNGRDFVDEDFSPNLQLEIGLELLEAHRLWWRNRMGMLRMPFHIGLRVFGRHVEIGSDSDRARKAIADAYSKSGGASSDLKRAYSEYLAYKKVREAAGKSS